MREAPLRMIASASASGTRVAMPSARVLLVFVVTTVPAANDKAYDGASVDCTPTISVVSPSRSRARMQPQMPDPCPIGT